MSENKYALPYQMTILPIHIFYQPAHEFQLYDSDVCKTLFNHYLEISLREEKKNNGK